MRLQLNLGASWPTPSAEESRITTKISALVRGIEHPHEYANTYARERLRDGSDRLRVGLRGGHVASLLTLAAVLVAPYKLLYILHTSRTGALLGRYESDVLNGPDVEAALATFGRFFGEDARHDVWLRSAGGGTLVLDRYNLLYAYGPLNEYERELERAGVRRGELARVPAPHALHYHAEWDELEREAARAFGWRITALRPEDRQFEDPARAN